MLHSGPVSFSLKTTGKPAQQQAQAAEGRALTSGGSSSIDSLLALIFRSFIQKLAQILGQTPIPGASDAPAALGRLLLCSHRPLAGLEPPPPPPAPPHCSWPSSKRVSRGRRVALIHPELRLDGSHRRGCRLRGFFSALLDIFGLDRTRSARLVEDSPSCTARLSYDGVEMEMEMEVPNI